MTNEWNPGDDLEVIAEETIYKIPAANGTYQKVEITAFNSGWFSLFIQMGDVHYATTEFPGKEAMKDFLINALDTLNGMRND